LIIDLSCPLEIKGYEILRDDGDNVRAYIELFNLMDKRVSQFDAVARWIATEYDEYDEMPFFADQLRASARTVFNISISKQNMPQADQLEIYFMRICFEDGSPDWLGDPDRLIDIDLNEEIEGRTLNVLMSLAGRDVVRFPRRTQDYWICVCGHVNAIALDQCRRCRRGRDIVLTSLAREAILLDKAPQLPEILMPDPIDPELPFFESEPSAIEIIDENDGYDEDDEIVYGEDIYDEDVYNEDVYNEDVYNEDIFDEVQDDHYDEDQAVDAEPAHPRYLLRNIVFLLVVITVMGASVFLWQWLGARSSRAREVRPPVPAQEEEQPSFVYRANE